MKEVTPPKGKKGDSKRDQRLREQLRQNLQKRKMKARALRSQADDTKNDAISIKTDEQN